MAEAASHQCGRHTTSQTPPTTIATSAAVSNIMRCAAAPSVVRAPTHAGGGGERGHGERPCRHRTQRCSRAPRRASAVPAQGARRRSASCRRCRAARRGRTTRARGRGAAATAARPARAGDRATAAPCACGAGRMRALRRSAQKPTAISAAPTSRSLHAEMSSIGGSRSRSSTAMAATATTPDAWPRPHVQPAIQPRRRSATAIGATAARWSGPEST